jgi:hypothetical protein
MLNVKVLHLNGERLGRLYLKETTTPVTTAEILKRIQSTISHPSVRAAQTNSVISLLLAQLATILKEQKVPNDFKKTESKR